MRWIVGDIHGMAQPLAALIQLVATTDPAARWIFVGDYVNRGPDSRRVIDLLLKLPNAKFCRGNHDDVFDVLLNGKSYVEQLTHNNRGGAYKWFMDHGLRETLASYGASQTAMREMLERPTNSGLDGLIAGVPPAHRRFIRELEPVIEEDDLFVVHARWDPATPDEDPRPTTYLQVDQDLRKVTTWGRFAAEDLDAPKTWRRTGFFGHTPVDFYGARGGFSRAGGGKLVPIAGEKMILLDTACALSPVGRLTAFCPELSSYLQVDRQGKPVDDMASG